jgi:RNA polymerase sigma-70 factor (ECF subfamily)
MGELQDWRGVQEKLAAGDRAAFLRVARLLTGVLAQLRAYDFRDEWDDLRQEVMLSVIANVRQGRIAEPEAFVAYVRIITRNKFVDRLKRRERQRERDTIPWEEETARAIARSPGALASDTSDEDLWAAVADLPEPGRQLVEGIYREGRTYSEMSEVSGIPLGTMKRRLRETLALLQRRLRSAR